MKNLKLPHITKRAVRQIVLLRKKLLSKGLGEDQIPVVVWASESTEPEFVPGPEIATLKKRDVPPQLVLEAHDVSVAFGLPDYLLEKYGDCTLDFIDGRFLFIDETMRVFLESGC